MCPIWPGQPITAHWGIEDPAAVTGTNIEIERAFVQAFKYMKTRIGLFLSLPLSSIGEMALGNKLHEIGRTAVPHRIPRSQSMSNLTVTIYHNPACGTSRNTLAMIRNARIEPVVIEYLKTPPSRAELAALAEQAGGARTLLREKEKLVAELGLNADVPDDAILDAIAAHPILLNRPVVVSPLGTKSCRPSEVVLELLPAAQQGAFTKEDGEAVVDAARATAS